MYKTINIYSCEKYKKYGNGSVSTRIDYDDEDDFIKKKKEAQERQRLINRQYRADYPVKKRTMAKVKVPGSDQLNAKQTMMVNNGKAGISPKQNFGLNIKSNPFSDTISGLPDLKLDKNTGNSVVLLGSSKAGKTTLLIKLFEEYFCSKDAPSFKSGFKQEPISVLFSVNMQAKIYQAPVFKKVIKVDKFEKESDLLIKKMKKINAMNKNKFNYMIVLDDIVDAKYSNVLNNLILTYRNSNFSSVISLQYPYLLSKSSRSSINQCFFGAFNTEESIEAVIKSFLGSQFARMGYTTLPAQIDLYRELTKDYHFLYWYSRERLLVRFKLDLNKK